MKEATYLGHLKDLILRLSAPDYTPKLQIVETDDVITLTIECIYKGDSIGLIDLHELAEELRAEKPAVTNSEYEIPETDKGFGGFGHKPIEAVYQGDFIGRKIRLTILCTEAGLS